MAFKTKTKTVGHYIIGKTIGEGTFGKVKLAIHIPTSEKVAVKVLEKKKIKQQTDVRRVNREIKILKRSKHVNIIKLYEVLDTQTSIYLIMENAEGGEMFDYIVSQRYLPEVQACNFFRQIVNGVEELHRNNITHRDLKPENLLLKKSRCGWIVKIVDFGLSNTHEEEKLLSTACGSPCYAAPEMIAGKRYYGPLVDIWSLGVILFALVCGYLPFEDPNTSQLYRKILSGNYTTPKWISHDINNLISKILETDSTKRYRISDIQKHSWYSISCDNIDNSCNKILSDDDPIIHSMSLNGDDPKEVIDGLVSSACNSLTATYHLLLQKRNRDLIIADNFKTKKAYDKTDNCKDEYSAEKTEKEAATYDAQIDKSRCDNDSVIPTPLMQVDGVPVSDARNASLTDDLHKSPAVIVIKNKDSPLKTVASARAPIASKPSKLSVRMQETHLR